MMEKLFINFLTFLKEADSKLVSEIVTFLIKYNLDSLNQLPISVNIVVFSTKVAFYNIFLLILATVLKIIFKWSNLVTIVLLISLIIFVLSTFVIFLGFFQVLFS